VSVHIHVVVVFGTDHDSLYIYVGEDREHLQVTGVLSTRPAETHQILVRLNADSWEEAEFRSKPRTEPPEQQ